MMNFISGALKGMGFVVAFILSILFGMWVVRFVDFLLTGGDSLIILL